MSEQLLELIIAIIVAVIGYVIGIFKDRQYNLKVEDVYNKYKLLFDVSGAVIKTVDEKLYVEMEEAIAKMKEAQEARRSELNEKASIYEAKYKEQLKAYNKAASVFLLERSKFNSLDKTDAKYEEKEKICGD